MKEMKIEYKNIDDVIPYENNPRHNDNAVEYVANSIEEFGFKVPIIIDKENVKYHYVCKQSKQAGGCATYRNYEREMEQLQLLQKKWGKGIVKIDNVANPNMKKEKVSIDYNPIIRIPIKGV